MVNFMQVSVSPPKLQYFKWLKSVFLTIYNCVWKPGFLKRSHIYSINVYFENLMLELLLYYVLITDFNTHTYLNQQMIYFGATII